MGDRWNFFFELEEKSKTILLSNINTEYLMNVISISTERNIYIFFFIIYYYEYIKNRVIIVEKYTTRAKILNMNFESYPEDLRKMLYFFIEEIDKNRN